MKILLTGSNGFLGRSLFGYLSFNNQIVRLSRSNSDLNIDLSFQIPEFNTDYDLVIHSAGKAHFNPKSNADTKLFFDANVLGTQNLLTGLSLFKIPKYFVFISSVSVYGLSRGNLINENTSLNALDPYGMSKIEAERLVLDWCNSYNVVCTILRLPLIVGPNPPGNLGSMIKGVQNGYYFNIAGGKAKKSMVLAEDISKCILKAAEIGGIYNLTDGYHPSFAELSECISIKLGKGKPLNMAMWLARIIANLGDLLGSKSILNSNKLKKITTDLTFDDSKAREVFGWNPRQILDGFNII